jgi:hypothetical protein
MRKVLGIAVFSGMLGVTLFGIFLTPVFFYVIEGFVEAPVWSSARLRRAGRIMMYFVGILTLGLPWVLPLFVRKNRRSVLASEEVADGGAARGAPPVRLVHRPTIDDGNGHKADDGAKDIHV